MDNELMRLVQRDTRPARTDRGAVEQARSTYRKVRQAAFEADAAIAYAEHAMERAVRLDRTRQILSQGDPALDLILAGFETDALNTVRRIGRDLTNGWGL